MIKHLHKLARYTALILISAAPLPFNDVYAETTEDQVAASELLLDKAPSADKPKTGQD